MYMYSKVTKHKSDINFNFKKKLQLQKKNFNFNFEIIQNKQHGHVLLVVPIEMSIRMTYFGHRLHIETMV